MSRLLIPRAVQMVSILHMIALHPQYVTDERGTRLAVMLPASEYDQLLNKLEMADDVAAYDRAKASGSDPVPLESLVAGLDQP